MYQFLSAVDTGSVGGTYEVGNRAIQACMAGLPTDTITREFSGMENHGGESPWHSRSVSKPETT
jgi:hypothetical protein